MAQEIAEIKYLAEVIKKFAPINGSGVPVADNIEDIAAHLLDNPDVICIMEPGKGILLAIVYPCYWNPSYLMAQEMGWWVEPEYRNTRLAIRLLKQFEAEAKARGAKKISMIALEAVEPEKVHRIYLKNNYKLVERNYMKGL